MPEVKKFVQYTNIFEKNRASNALVNINVGGKGSSKSYSIAQLLISKMVSERDKVIGISRKTFPSLRMTAMKLYFDLLKEYGIYDESKHNKTFNSYEHGTNLVQFFGLDEEEKARSADFSYLWMEEANDFTYGDYTTFKLQLRHKSTDGKKNQLFLSLNPTDANGWIPERASKESDAILIHSTYRDNPFLTKDYVKSLEDLLYADDYSYRVYTLGEWGRLEGRIYTKYTILPELPNLDKSKWAYGLDFGLVNPSAIVKVYLLDDKVYAEERLYQSGLTNSDLIEKFSHEQRGDIHGDPSAKMMIEEIRRAGYAAFEGHKGVKESIDLCQRQTLFIPQSSTNLIKEIQSYHWKKDKDNSESFLPEPVKMNDHAMDALRYAIWGLTSRYGFATQRPTPFKPISSLHFSRRKH